ncbi:MAG: MFS transporter, partial [Clostridia bacterium]|nr:MFS transporter [Clostridia bacterium]
MKKTISKGKIWCFAIGQLGWSILSALISSWLVNYYQPDQTTIEGGHALFVPQGAIILGMTIIGLITAFGRVFDAVTDPLIASASDRCRSKNGRRIPFMKWAAIPFGVATALVFFSPMSGNSGAAGTVNAVFLFVMVTLFYLFMTMYCTPYNALIAELGSTQKVRMSISTCISFTFIAGMAFAYLAPVIWGALTGFGLERMLAIRITMAGLALIGVGCMFVPVFTIKENDYIDIHPTED